MDNDFCTIVSHPCLQGKLSLLANKSIPAPTVRSLLSQTSTILAVESSAKLKTNGEIAVVPVMRSGLAMVDGFLDVLTPRHKVRVHHLGLYRDPTTLDAVEYYNNVPVGSNPANYAFIIDPILATGATIIAAIDSLTKWKVENIIVVSLLATEEALQRIHSIYNGTVLVFTGAIQKLDGNGRLAPGIGDIGDRLYF